MKVKRPRAVRSDRTLAQLLRTGLLVLALVLQGYISQVHHHDYAASTLSTIALNGDASESPLAPIDSDGRDHHCFICHLSGHGSISILPPAIVLAVVSSGFVFYRIARDSLESHDAPSFYSSRAPPSLILPA